MEANLQRECACKATRYCIKCVDNEYRKNFPELLPICVAESSEIDIKSFEPGLLPGLELITEFVTPEQEEALVESLLKDENWKSS